MDFIALPGRCWTKGISHLIMRESLSRKHVFNERVSITNWSRRKEDWVQEKALVFLSQATLEANLI